MFNGIIFNQGLVKKITKRKRGINLFLKSNLKIKKKDIGISVSCDGVCLTLINIKNKLMEFYLSNETIKRTKFKNIIVGNKSIKPRLTKVPTIIPLPKKKHYVSIYELQKN